MQDNEQTYLGIEALAGETGLPLAWLRREARDGRIPTLHVGRRLMFNPDAVTRVLEARASQDQHNAPITTPGDLDHDRRNDQCPTS